ncbi:MAG: ribonuclease Z [Thermodesulfobacteriota bacterium]|nr:ribonuclease Z [Thermodesulfobacteriota bacterium]
MEVIFLGTGTGAPSAKRGSPGLAVLSGGRIFLIDSGSGSLRQLAKAGLSHNELDYILYTHFHPDHTAELIAYLFAAWYPQGFTRLEPARIYGPAGLLKLHSHFRDAYGKWVSPPKERVVFEELPVGAGHVFWCGPVRVESGPIPHSPESLGYRLTGPGGKTLAVTGDTDYGPGLIELAQDADLLVTECSFPEGQKVDGHLTPSLAGRAAREAGALALALTHFYPETNGHDLLTFVQKEFDGPITLAQDLERLRV